MQKAKQMQILSLAVMMTAGSLQAESKTPWWKKLRSEDKKESSQQVETKPEQKVAKEEKAAPQKRPWWKFPYRQVKETEIVELDPSHLQDKEPQNLNLNKRPTAVPTNKIKKETIQDLATQEKSIKEPKLAPLPGKAPQKLVIKDDLKKVPHAKKVDFMPKTSISKVDPNVKTDTELKPIQPKKSFFGFLSKLFKKKPAGDQKVVVKKNSRRETRQLKDQTETYSVPLVQKKIRRTGKNRFQFNT